MNLSDRKIHVASLATYLFERINKTKKISGVYVFLREIDKPYNMVLSKIFFPTQNNQLDCIEKAAILLIENKRGGVVSISQKDTKNYAASIIFSFKNRKYQSSVGGLKTYDQNLLVAIMLLAIAISVPVEDIIYQIKESGGSLPHSFIIKKSSLFKILKTHKI